MHPRLPPEGTLTAPLLPDVLLERYAESLVPTEYGVFRVVVFREREDPMVEHLALVYGDIQNGQDILTRAHSECWTGEVLHSLKCDCREQLDLALRLVVSSGAGVVLYLRQEGRGIGLGNKIRAYALQAEGADTVDANRLLGFPDDLRTWHGAAAMLRSLGVQSIALMTNNPAKVAGLTAEGIAITRRVPVSITLNRHNLGYLQTKQDRMGHELPQETLQVDTNGTYPRRPLRVEAITRRLRGNVPSAVSPAQATSWREEPGAPARQPPPYGDSPGIPPSVTPRSTGGGAPPSETAG